MSVRPEADCIYCLRLAQIKKVLWHEAEVLTRSELLPACLLLSHSKARKLYRYDRVTYLPSLWILTVDKACFYVAVIPSKSKDSPLISCTANQSTDLTFVGVELMMGCVPANHFKSIVQFREFDELIVNISDFFDQNGPSPPGVRRYFSLI